jgi:hypothetical protein
MPAPVQPLKIGFISLEGKSEGTGQSGQAETDRQRQGQLS